MGTLYYTLGDTGQSLIVRLQSEKTKYWVIAATGELECYNSSHMDSYAQPGVEPGMPGQYVFVTSNAIPAGIYIMYVLCGDAIYATSRFMWDGTHWQNPSDVENTQDSTTRDDIFMRRPPVEITRSLADFRIDNPDQSRLAFVMMQFGTTKAHEQVFTAIRAALDPHQFVALRADIKQYHDDLWWNIATYMYGCRFGIGVFERIEDEAFNPNVSLEVGYMMGLGKPVCYLTERTLQNLHTDLVGKIYKEFDMQSCKETIPRALSKWMNDKGLMVRQVERSDDEAGE